MAIGGKCDRKGLLGGVEYEIGVGCGAHMKKQKKRNGKGCAGMGIFTERWRYGGFTSPPVWGCGGIYKFPQILLPVSLESRPA